MLLCFNLLLSFYYSFEVLLVVNYFLPGMIHGYHQPNMAMEIKLIQCYIQAINAYKQLWESNVYSI